MQWSDNQVFLCVWLSEINERADLAKFTARPACRFLLSPPVSGERGGYSEISFMRWKAVSFMRGCHGPLNTQRHYSTVAEITYDPGNLFREVSWESRKKLRKL